MTSNALSNAVFSATDGTRISANIMVQMQTTIIAARYDSGINHGANRKCCMTTSLGQNFYNLTVPSAATVLLPSRSPIWLLHIDVVYMTY
jgi:hypothetical protein